MTLHLDVKIVFLHDMLQEEVYVEKPQGFEVEDRKTHVCWLMKELYDLKQAHIAWYTRMESYLVKLRFIRSNVDPNFYFKVIHECKSLPTSMKINFKKLCEYVARPDLENPSKYKQLIGALMFLVNAHPDICYVVNTLSQFMPKPLHSHWIPAKHILGYLHGMITLGLRYFTGDVRLHGYIAAD
eukprot:PITA_02240